MLEIARTLEAAGHEAWCVGGALRDALLRNPHADYDFATSARPEEVQRLFRRTAAVGVKYGTVGVIDRQRVLHEVTTFRRDVATDGRHAVVEYGVSLDEDLARRDFTINAIAYHPAPARVAGSVRRRAATSSDAWCAPWAIRPRASREDYLRILRAHPIRGALRLRGRAGRPGPRLRRRRRDSPGSPPSGCGRSGSRACAARGTSASWCGSGTRSGAARGVDARAGAGRGRPARAGARRRASAIRCCSRLA